MPADLLAGEPLPSAGDASDVAISTTFGPNTLKSFKVWTREASTGAGYEPL